MTLVSSGEIGLLHTTDTRCIVLEIFRSRLTGKSILNCRDNARPTISSDPEGVAITDFYGHTQYDDGTIEGKNTSSISLPHIRDNFGTGYNLTGSYVEYWDGDPGVTTIRVYKSSSLDSLVSGDGVALFCWRRAAGSSDSWSNYQTISPYLSTTVAVDMFTFDYQFDLQDIP